MIEQFKAVYATNSGVKVAAFAGLLLCAVVFAVLSGGFPPQAWRFLFFSVLPNLSQLSAQQGGAVLLPLLGLILLSLSLFIVWGVLVTGMIKVAMDWWREYRERKDFSMDLREAELLAEQNLASSELDLWLGPKELSKQQQQAPSLRLSATSDAVNTGVTRVQERAPQREYATSARGARVSGGGIVFPETPTPIANPTFMPSYPVVPPLTSLERPAPWMQQGGGQSAAAPNNQNRPLPLHSTNKLAALPPFSLPSTVQPKQLRIVPPPPLEKEQDADDQQPIDIDKAFSKLLERSQQNRPEQHGQANLAEQVEHLPQSSPPAIARQHTSPARDEIEEVPDTDATWLLAGPTHTAVRNDEASTAASTRYTSDAEAFQTMDTPGSIHTPGSIYDTIPFDESKLPTSQAGTEAEDAPRLIVSIGLDPGIKRRNAPNEDSIFAIQGVRITDNGSTPAGLFVVADGMGGHANGREASRMAIHTVSDVIVPTLLRDVSGRDEAEEETILLDMLKDGVHRANLAIYRRNRETRPEMMGTTLTAALIANSTAYIGNIGDSRTYLYRPGEGLRQVTRDHSEVARLVESGAIKPEEIYTHPQRNRINRCLGERAAVDLDTFIEPLQPGDVLILCSDGLWEMVHDDTLAKLVASSAHNPTQLSAMLVQAALNQGGEDNIGVVVVGYLPNQA